MATHLYFCIAVASSVFLLSCSEIKMKEDVSRGQATPSEIANEGAPNPTSGAPSGSLNPSIEEPALSAEAFPPVPISGAYLTCVQDNNLADCKAFDGNKLPYDFAETAAYIIEGSPLKWKKASFTQQGVGHWQIPLVDPIPSNYAIALVNGKNEVLADWILGSNPAPSNLVADGSFESFVVEAPGVYQYFPNSASVAWKSRLPDPGATCPDPFIEVQSAASFAPFDGNNSIELNSGCRIEGQDDGPNRVTVYQQLNLIPGHLYQFNFMAAMRVRTSRFSASFGGGLVFEKELNSTTWNEFSAVVAAKSANSLIEFQDLINNGTVRGTMIDSVSVYDLGSGPE